MALNGGVKTAGVVITTAIAIGAVAWGMGRGDTDSLKVCVADNTAAISTLRVDSATVATKLELVKESVDKNNDLLREILRELNAR